MTTLSKSCPHWLLALGLFFISSYSAQTFAEIVGQVIEAEGDVTVNGHALNGNSEIYDNYIIKTGEDGKITLSMIDDATIELGKNSELNIKEYHYRVEGSENSVVMDVVKGFFRTVSGSVGKNTADNYRVNTPLSSIGIQGTNYQILVKYANEFIGARKGVIVVQEKNNGSLDHKQTAYLGDNQEGRFLRVSPPIGGVRAIGSTPEWEKFSDKPEDFPEEFQW